MAAANFSGGKPLICGVEVTVEFANWFQEIERREQLDERRETRRHQSLGDFCIPDETVDTFSEAERKQIAGELKSLLRQLSKQRRFIIFHYTVYKMSFREIGDRLGLHKETVRVHFHASVKKLQKLLKKHTVNLSLPWLLGEGLKALS